MAEEHVGVLAVLDNLASEYGLELDLLAARREIAAMLRAFTEALAREIKAPAFAASAENYRKPVLRLGAQILADWELKPLERMPAAA